MGKNIKSLVKKFAEKISGMIKISGKKNGGKEVIMEFALGAIAIVLAVVFREQLQNVIETVGSTFSSKISALFSKI